MAEIKLGTKPTLLKVPSVVHLSRRGFTKSRCFKKNGQAFDYKRKL